VSAYRSARRNADGLFNQVLAIEEAIAEIALDHRLVTAVLAGLDVGSGLLRYVNAGHPPPLLMRGGKAVEVLGGGRRPLFGLGPGPLVVGEELLQPGDWLVLYPTASPRSATTAASSSARPGSSTSCAAPSRPGCPHPRRCAGSSPLSSTTRAGAAGRRHRRARAVVGARAVRRTMST